MKTVELLWYNQTMENSSTSSVFQITCGNLSDVDDVLTFCLTGVDAVKKAARRFVTVIPDDQTDYLNDIDDWNGADVLEFHHQDDDDFSFRAQLVQIEGPAQTFSLPKEFTKLVKAYRH